MSLSLASTVLSALFTFVGEVREKTQAQLSSQGCAIVPSTPNFRALSFPFLFFVYRTSGMPALAAIEAVPTDSKDKPREDIVLVKATVFSNPVTEMEDALEQELQAKIDAREVSYGCCCCCCFYFVDVVVLLILSLLLRVLWWWWLCFWSFFVLFQLPWLRVCPLLLW